VLGPDGTVAEQGSYEELSTRPDGAFTKLMEWQMSGGDQVPSPTPVVPPEELYTLEKATEQEFEEDEEVEEIKPLKKE
jgi:putative ABC transport system ATP-binding protein